ncbi:conjugal transfer protein TraF [Reinekea sp.]|uniref:conjugal transfer protein TraF n=1 Tax=Reinekea sp. TaxID=1970455 RepID=UPI002A81C3EA|nr:conjugal transfer protein TraF [Reinekea sp.]
MKRSVIILITAISSATVSWGDTIHFLNSGPSTTLGPVSNAKIASSGRFNPALTVNNTSFPQALLDVGVNVQLQGLGEFNSVLEDMSDRIDEISITFEGFGDGNASVGNVLADINTLETSFDQGIERLADNFYIKPGVVFSVPLTPWSVNTNRFGTYTIGISSLTQARASILHGDISFDIDTQAITDTNDSDEDLDPLDFMRTTSSLYLKQAQIWNADLSWSRELPQIDFLSRVGVDAVGGLRATLIAYNLQKNLYPIKDIARQALDSPDALSEDLRDDVLSGFSDFNYNVSLDAGITLRRDNTLLGITLYNLNNPELSYKELGGNCAAIADTDDQSDCFHAEHFASVGDIALQESHRLSPSMTVDISHSFLDNRIALAGAIDLWRKTDLFGDQSQKLNLGLVLQPNAWYWPRLRLGFGKDLVDPDPTQLGLGLSLFNFLQLDTQMTAVLGDLSSEDLTISGNALRSLSASASINLAF